MKRAVMSTSRLEWTFAATHALQVSRMFWNPWRQIRINTVLAHRSTKAFARANLRLQLKYLVEYASRALSTQQRWTLLCKHYEFLQRYFSATFFQQIFASEICLWTSAAAETTISIVLDFPHLMHTEGDLRITMKLDDAPIYRLIFVVGSGDIFDSPQKNVILVTCIQGLAETRLLRIAANACEQVHPSDLLMSALGGFAQACSIETAFGIKTADQIANTGKIYFSYEEFFEKYGASYGCGGLYRFTVPFLQKEMHTISSNHRSRTRRKRELKCRVAQEAIASLQNLRMPGSPLMASTS